MKRDVLGVSFLPITLVLLLACGLKSQFYQIHASNTNTQTVEQNDNSESESKLIQFLETPKSQASTNPNNVDIHHVTTSKNISAVHYSHINQNIIPKHINYHFNYYNMNHYLNWVRYYNSSHQNHFYSYKLTNMTKYIKYHCHKGSELSNLLNYTANAKYISPRYYSHQQLINYLNWAYKYNISHNTHLNTYHMNNIRNYINDGYSNSIYIPNLLHKVDIAIYRPKYNVEPALHYLYWVRWYQNTYQRPWLSSRLNYYHKQIKSHYRWNSYPSIILRQVLYPHFKKHITHYHDNHSINHYNSNVVNNTDYNFYTDYYLDDNTINNHAKHLTSNGGNVHVIFAHPIYLPYTKLGFYNFGYKYGDPQSMIITPSGKIEVLYNATHSGLDYDLNRILQYDTHGNVTRVGRRFFAGHGQGLTYDYRDNSIWLCKNHYGDDKGMLPGDLIIQRISPNNLAPIGKKQYITSNSILGENVAMSKNNLYNVVRSYFNHSYSPYGSLRIYQAPLNSHKLYFIKSILHSPGAVIQNIEYNPLNNRLYIVCNGSLMSLPLNNLAHLTNHDIHVAKFSHNEFESLGFYKHRIYLLLNHPSRLLTSNTIL